MQTSFAASRGPAFLSWAGTGVMDSDVDRRSGPHVRARAHHPNAHVRYVPSMELWDGYDQIVAEVAATSGAVQIGELGGGANPTLSLADRIGHPIELTVLDISAAELAKAPRGVRTVEADLAGPEPFARRQFDLVFSRMLCEHVASGERFHRNCWAALRPGGHAVHFFPAATALPFVANRLVPEALGTRLLSVVWPGRANDGNHGKFPARYHWCWGPTAGQIERYRSVGFEVVRTHVGVGHHYYDRIPALGAAERAKTRRLLAHPSPWAAAYVAVVLQRPFDSIG